jgi:hypothetical protein
MSNDMLEVGSKVQLMLYNNVPELEIGVLLGAYQNYIRKDVVITGTVGINFDTKIKLISVESQLDPLRGTYNIMGNGVII